MGYTKILWVYEDGIRGAEVSKEIWEEIKPELGEAILKVCFGAKYAEVRGHVNCVNFCDEVHSTDAKLYLWNRNCLIPISKCDNEELKVAKNLIDEEISFIETNRKKKREEAKSKVAELQKKPIKQVIKLRKDKFKIQKPFSQEQLDKIKGYLIPEPDGKGYFDNFVLFNKEHYPYPKINSKEYTTEENIFDILKLLFLVLPEVCGINRNWILFDDDIPKSNLLIHPDNIEISRDVYDTMIFQLIEIINEINKDITIFHHNKEFLLHAPKIT